MSTGTDLDTAALIDRLPRLEIIGNFGVGYDSVDLAAAIRRDVVVTNTPDVLNDEMGDFTVGLLISTIRRLPQADRFVRVTEGGAAVGEVRTDGRHAVAVALGGPTGDLLFMLTAETVGRDNHVARRTARVEVTQVDVPGVGRP